MKTAIIMLLLLFAIPSSTHAQTNDISEEISYELEKYDFQSFDAFFGKLPVEIRDTLGESVEDMIEKYAYKGTDESVESVFDKIKNIFVSAVLKNMVPISKILAVGILSGLALSITAKDKSENSENAVGLICMGICILIIFRELADVIQSAAVSVISLNEFSQASMPVLSMLIASAGSVGTSGMLSPLSAFLNGFVVNMFKNTVLPLTLAMVAVSVINTMSNDGNLNNLLKLIKTALKWIIGLTFTVYMGMLSVQGIAAYNADSAAVKSVKFALDKSVPIVGSVVSGTLSTVVSCVGMIKNAAGISAVVIAAFNLLVPLLNIGGMTFALRMGAALCETVSDKRISKLLSSLADVCNYLFASVVSVGIMFMITLGICIMIGN